MWFANCCIVLTLMPAILTRAWPIRVHQPTAVTSPTPTQLTAQQIDYLFKQYAAATAPRLVLTPPHHDYVSIDSPFLKSTKPAKADEPSSSTPHYFVPTIRPYSVKNPGGYDFYFPQADDLRAEQIADAEEAARDAVAGQLNLSYLRQMQPPAQSAVDDEPNYYAMLKMNTGNKKAPPKKFNATHKQVNLKGALGKASVSKLQPLPEQQQQQQHEQLPELLVNENGDSVAADTEYAYEALNQAATQLDAVTRQPERLTPKSVIRTLRAEELNTGEYLPTILRNGNAAGQRVAYQMHGFNGPQSYRFGYDTGKGENRQFRVEQRDKDGNVAGEYGYYDNSGKMNVFKYTSSADDGFRSQKIQ